VFRLSVYDHPAASFQQDANFRLSRLAGTPERPCGKRWQTQEMRTYSPRAGLCQNEAIIRRSLRPARAVSHTAFNCQGDSPVPPENPKARHRHDPASTSRNRVFFMQHFDAGFSPYIDIHPVGTMPVPDA
jgi:hypothetical protein